MRTGAVFQMERQVNKGCITSNFGGINYLPNFVPMANFELERHVLSCPYGWLFFYLAYESVHSERADGLMKPRDGLSLVPYVNGHFL